MTTTEDRLMAQITFDIPIESVWRLENALQNELHKWEIIRLEAIAGKRPEASPEGAQILVDDTQLILDQLKAWKENL